MKAVVWTEPNHVEVQEREIPDAKGRVLIRVGYAGICGTDIGIYHGMHPRAKAPVVLGHEFSGVVEKIGEGVENCDLVPGDRVVVNPLYYCGKCRACLSGNTHVCRSLRLYGTDSDGGMAEYAAIPVESVYRLPAAVSLRLAAVTEPVAVVVHALRQVKKDFYTNACVTGLGPMGLLTALMLRDSGVRSLIAVEANENRAAYGRKLGFTVINPNEQDPVQYVLDHTEGEGADLLVEASGSPAVADIMTSLAGVRAEILLLSVFKKKAAIDLRDINFKEQKMIGTRVYAKVDFKDAIDYVSRNEDKIASVVSHVFPIDDAAAVFEEITGGRTNMMKVLFDCMGGRGEEK